MRIIHTADWHLGNAMDEIDRTEEHKQFLDWLREKIRKDKPNAQKTQKAVRIPRVPKSD